MSTTYIAAFVGVVSVVCQLFGYTVETPELTKTLTEVVTLGTLAYVFYGRYKAGGISAFGIKKQ